MAWLTPRRPASGGGSSGGKAYVEKVVIGVNLEERCNGILTEEGWNVVKDGWPDLLIQHGTHREVVVCGSERSSVAASQGEPCGYVP